MKTENKRLTDAFTKAIEADEAAHPGELSVGIIVISLLCVWGALFECLPESGSHIDDTPGFVAPPPRIEDMVQ